MKLQNEPLEQRNYRELDGGLVLNATIHRQPAAVLGWDIYKYFQFLCNMWTTFTGSVSDVLTY